MALSLSSRGKDELDAKGLADPRVLPPKGDLEEWEEQGQPEWDMKQGLQEEISEREGKGLHL